MDRARASKRVVIVLAVLAAAGGCATEFERRFDAAERLRLQAAAQGYEWIGTRQLLEQARAEEESGNAEAAMALVEKARFQAEAALQQAEREAEAWQRRVVR